MHNAKSGSVTLYLVLQLLDIGSWGAMGHQRRSLSNGFLTGGSFESSFHGPWVIIFIGGKQPITSHI